ncbi:MAG: hypothetical protein AABW72_02875 [archaeon]
MQKLPESDLIRKTLTIRQMDVPPSTALTKRAMLRWFALAIGQISENESRDTGVNVIDAVFYFLISKRKQPTTLEVIEYIKEKHKKEMSEKLTRYHLNKLIDLGFLQRKGNKYMLNAAPLAERDDLKQSFEHWSAKTFQEGIVNIKLVLDKLVESYK